MIANITTSGLTAGEVKYARLLYLSGFGVRRIAEVLGQPAGAVHRLQCALRWRRITPARLHAPIGLRRPVVVRCPACAARYGEELGTPRPCPQCGFADRDSTDPAQLSVFGRAG